MKIIAFYLPQFYEFEENDKWWGKGFTEWTNVRKAKPLYKGHYQPTRPLNDNYYSLDDLETMRWQIGLAKKYGIYGFCFYHYWFGNNRKLMEKPIENFLENKDLNFPFCLCWANHDWTRTWTGDNNEVLMDVQYGDSDEWEKHFNYLLPFFKDPRYIKIDGKPLLVIYLPQLIPQFREMIAFFDRMAEKAGYEGITYAAQSLFEEKEKNSQYIDYFIQYEPNCSRLCAESGILGYLKAGMTSIPFAKDILKVKIRKMLKKISKKKMCYINTYDYDATWNYILRRKVDNDRWIAGAFVNCDVTPRRQDRALIYKGASPEKFEGYMRKLIYKVEKEYKQKIIFISAWNEWGEGMYLEPDEKNKYRYLEALKKSMMQKDDFI